MVDRPYTVLSCGVSLDGYLDSATVSRLVLSNDADFDRVDAVRAGCDAIMVGAATVRKDNPRLLVRSGDRQEERLARGAACSPTKVTVTASGELDADANFFALGDVAKIVYCPADVAPELADRLAGRAEVVALGERPSMQAVSEDLSARGVDRLMVEGGGTVLTQFLTGELADELQLVMAPFFVGDSRAPRFVNDGEYPWNADRRAELVEARPIGDVVLLRYALSPRFDDGWCGR